MITVVAKKKGFSPGQSGNPKGRPKGSLNKATLLAQQLLAGEAETLAHKVIDLAKDGNLVALKLCLERLLPPLKGTALHFALPSVNSAADGKAAYDAIFGGLSKGQLTVEEADGLSRLLQCRFQALELGKLAEQIAELKENLK